MNDGLRVLLVGLLSLRVGAECVARQTPAPPVPAALQAQLQAAHTDSARYAVHLETASTYAGALDSTGANLRRRCQPAELLFTPRA